MAIGSSLMQAEGSKSRALRAPFLALGLLCVGLGYVGILLPGMPSTVFFLIALWSFKRSSPRFESWLLSHRVFGPTLRNWEEHRAISARTKVVAIASLVVFVTISLFAIKNPWAQGLVLASALVGVAVIATRKTLG